MASAVSFWLRLLVIMAALALAVVSATPISLQQLPLRTRKNEIVDAQGKTVRLSGMSWYGADEKAFVVAGLDRTPLAAIVGYVAASGFNHVRIPFSIEMAMRDPVVRREDVTANAHLAGRTALEVLDHIVEAFATAGIASVMDNHVSDADWCCSLTDGNGLWYTSTYSEDDWLGVLGQIASRYASQPYVIGFDLRNELRASVVNGSHLSPVWGGAAPDPRVDWRAAAMRGAERVLAVNTHMLIIVEGINYALELGAVAQYPIELSEANRLVYSAHAYSWDYKENCTGLRHTWESNWGFIHTRQLAPVWIGEFGTTHDDKGVSSEWFVCLMDYLGSKTPVHWNWWALDGTQAPATGRTKGAEETFGMLNVHWNETAYGPLLQALQKIQVYQ